MEPSLEDSALVEEFCPEGTKISLCRFYLRGLCPIPAPFCKYAHGIDDLNYTSRQNHEKVHYEFTGECCLFYQQNGQQINEKDKSYNGLYEYYLRKKDDMCWREQIPSDLSLQGLNKSREVKILIRRELHMEQFEKFMKLMQKFYYQINQYFEVQFIKTEYYRVGFNKLMTRIKYGHLDQFLSNHQNGYFKHNTCIVPEAPNRRKVLYLKRATLPEICQEYSDLCMNYLKEEADTGAREVSEEGLKTFLLQTPRNWKRVPPINQFLNLIKSNLRTLLTGEQEDHCEFGEIRKMIKEKKLPGIRSEEQIIEELIVKFVRESLHQNGYCILEEEVYGELIRLKFNNKTLIKKMLNKCLNTYKNKVRIFKVSLIGEVIINMKSLQPNPYIKQKNNKSELYNALNQRLNNKYLALSGSNKQEQLTKEQNGIMQQNRQLVYLGVTILGKSYFFRQKIKLYLIETEDQLLAHFPYLQKISIVSIDLQGSLHSTEKGYIALIQIYIPQLAQIIIIDVLTIKKNEKPQSIELVNDFMKLILIDNAITKVFHDCRGDLSALLYLLPANVKSEEVTTQLRQISNIFDTSIAYIIIQQLKEKKNSKTELSSPSLNTVLDHYGTEDNINTLKQKFHKMWDQGKRDPAAQRPLNHQFIEYCAMDVIGLPEAYQQMKVQASQFLLFQICQRSILCYFQTKKIN